MRYFIGDVRDESRLMEAFHGVDYIIHAAALKQVPTAEYNPFETIMTNILGAKNVIRAAIKCKVKKVVALSTDKAANPINLYGATKLCSDKLFIAANDSMAGGLINQFAVVRYGNVLGSRGSVLPLFMKQRDEGKITVTDGDMTRFWISLTDAVSLVLEAFETMQGGEVYVPKIPSCTMLDFAKAVGGDSKIEVIGIRPGEKMHELMIPEDEAMRTLELDKYFIIQPNLYWWKSEKQHIERGAKPCEKGFYYSSNNNPMFLNTEATKEFIDSFLEKEGILNY
jgi:UDP-N-acetylglucosamine 4,6-dehydratase